MFKWFIKNEFGIWCNWCHELIWAPWFDEYQNEEEPSHCPECGGDADGPA